MKSRYYVIAALLVLLGFNSIEPAVCQEKGVLDEQENTANAKRRELEFAIQARRDLLVNLQSKMARFDALLHENQLALENTNSKRRTLHRELSGISVSEESYAEISKLLHTEKIQLTIELAGLEARIEEHQNIEDRIKKKRNAKMTGIQDRLEKLVQMEQENVDSQKVQFKSGVLPHAELAKAERRLLDAQIRLLESKNQSASGNDDVQKMLTNVLLEFSEKRAKLERVNRLLDAHSESRSVYEKLVATGPQVRSLEVEIDEMKKKIREVKMQYEQQGNTLKRLQSKLDSLDN